MSPVGLTELLEALPRNVDPNLLVGFETSDDAAVYRLDDETALVSTADIITPPVDDPRAFGRIAAANALSDIYAMGARPVTCLSLLGFPEGKLDEEVLHGIVSGAVEKVTEAGAVLAGGHTTEDEEPKFGLAVTGLVHPQRYWTNTGAQPGDVLVLTKPLGSGVLFNANLQGRVSEPAMEACLAIAETLNRDAADAIRAFSPHSVTDVTGFGLAGHALEMAMGSEVTLRVELASLPVMDEALEMYERGVTTGVNAGNRDYIAARTSMRHDAPKWHEEIVIDPQTSGGLLISISAEQSDQLLDALRDAGIDRAAAVGSVEPYDGQHHLIVE